MLFIRIAHSLSLARHADQACSPYSVSNSATVCLRVHSIHTLTVLILVAPAFYIDGQTYPEHIGAVMPVRGQLDLIWAWFDQCKFQQLVHFLFGAMHCLIGRSCPSNHCGHQCAPITKQRHCVSDTHASHSSCPGRPLATICCRYIYRDSRREKYAD
jgi:hypothetical protein